MNRQRQVALICTILLLTVLYIVPRYGYECLAIILLILAICGITGVVYNFYLLKRKIRFCTSVTCDKNTLMYKRKTYLALAKLRANCVRYLLFCIFGIFGGFLMCVVADYEKANGNWYKVAFLKEVGIACVVVYGACSVYLCVLYCKRRNKSNSSAKSDTAI
jgi:hypothetical protein